VGHCTQWDGRRVDSTAKPGAGARVAGGPRRRAQTGQAPQRRRQPARPADPRRLTSSPLIRNCTGARSLRPLRRLYLEQQQRRSRPLLPVETGTATPPVLTAPWAQTGERVQHDDRACGATASRHRQQWSACRAGCCLSRIAALRDRPGRAVHPGRKRQRARERNSASHEPFADGASWRFGSAIASRDAGLRHGPTHRRSRVRSRIACQAGTSVTLRLRHTPSGTRTWGPRYRSSEVRDASKPDRDADFPGRVVVEQNEVRRPRRRIRLAVEP
jgi:hypothetical protein